MELIKLVDNLLKTMFTNNFKSSEYNKIVIKYSCNSIIVVILVLFSLICFTNQMPMLKKQRYCGAVIYKVMRDVCNGSYNGYDSREYSYRSQYFSDSDNSGGNYNHDDGMSYSAPIIRRPKQRRRLIVEECCHSPCDMATIRQYCGNDNSETEYHHTVEHPPRLLSKIDETEHNNDRTEYRNRNDLIISSTVVPTTTIVSTLTTTAKVRKKLNKKQRGRELSSCRCRKRKRRYQPSIICVPCKRKCKNENKSPFRCQKILIPYKPEYEIGTIPSSESDPHVIHDISSHIYQD